MLILFEFHTRGRAIERIPCFWSGGHGNRHSGRGRTEVLTARYSRSFWGRLQHRRHRMWRFRESLLNPTHKILSWFVPALSLIIIIFWTVWTFFSFVWDWNLSRMSQVINFYCVPHILYVIIASVFIINVVVLIFSMLDENILPF